MIINNFYNERFYSDIIFKWYCKIGEFRNALLTWTLLMQYRETHWKNTVTLDGGSGWKMSEGSEDLLQTSGLFSLNMQKKLELVSEQSLQTQAEIQTPKFNPGLLNQSVSPWNLSEIDLKWIQSRTCSPIRKRTMRFSIPIRHNIQQ